MMTRHGLVLELDNTLQAVWHAASRFLGMVASYKWINTHIFMYFDHQTKLQNYRVRGWKAATYFFAFSFQKWLQNLGLSRREIKSVSKSVSEAAESGSAWVWSKYIQRSQYTVRVTLLQFPTMWCQAHLASQKEEQQQIAWGNWPILFSSSAGGGAYTLKNA